MKMRIKNGLYTLKLTENRESQRETGKTAISVSISDSSQEISILITESLNTLISFLTQHGERNNEI